MARNFETTMELGLTGVSREDLYELLRSMKPTESLVNPLGLQILDNKIHLGNKVGYFRKYTVGYADLSAAALTNNVEIFQLPENGVLQAVKIKHSAAFTGGAVSALKLDVGVATDLGRYISQYDAHGAPGGAVYRTAFAPLFDKLAFTEAVGLTTGAIAAAFTQADNTISGLTISAAYSQTEVQALRTKCEELADGLRAMRDVLAPMGESYIKLVAAVKAMTGGTPGGGSEAMSVRLNATATGANLNQLTQGSADVWACWTLLE